MEKLALNVMGIEKSILNRKQLLNDITKKAKTYFYADLPTVWFSFINANVRSISDLLDENIFDNPLFLIDNNMINVKSNNWTDAGILKVSDVWNDTTNTFISKLDLEKDHKITISDIIYNQIVSALAFQIKKFLKVRMIVNYKLFVWEIKKTPNCDYCGQNDNLEHFFFYYPDTYHFWDQIRT